MILENDHIKIKVNSHVRVSKPITGVNDSIRNVKTTDIQTKSGGQAKTSQSENEVSTLSTQTVTNSYKWRNSDTGES